VNGECLRATDKDPGRCGSCEGCFASLPNSIRRQVQWIEAAAMGAQLQAGANFTAALNKDRIRT
jgi:hypothetical protein